MTLTSVDFPAPLGPISPVTRPRSMVKLTLSTAVRPAKDLTAFSTRSGSVPAAACVSGACGSRGLPNHPCANSVCPARPAGRSHSTSSMARLTPTIGTPKISGIWIGPSVKPRSNCRSTSCSAMTRPTPTTAPVTVPMPPTISIAT
jgi:hypothetical protein